MMLIGKKWMMEEERTNVRTTRSKRILFSSFNELCHQSSSCFLSIYPLFSDLFSGFTWWTLGGSLINGAKTNCKKLTQFRRRTNKQS